MTLLEIFNVSENYKLPEAIKAVLFSGKRENTLRKIKENGINEDYFLNVLRMMQEEELIEGLKYCRPFGSEIILLSSFSELRITAKGIEHLEENSTMKKAREDALSGAPGVIMELVKLVLL